MAHRYTDFPKFIGEKNLAKQISSFNDQKLHFWFGLDYIPGVRDVDILVWHENVGVFVVEVKAVPLEDEQGQFIEFFGWESYKIRGRVEDDPPYIQANEALNSLRDFLRPQVPNRQIPYLVGTVCWPLITREAWNRYWDDERVVGEFSARMIFKEDIEGGIDAFIERLVYVRSHPPAKEPPKYPHFHRSEQLEKIKECLTVRAKKKAAPSDLEKLRIIEEKVARETVNEFLPNGNDYVLYYGYPGTGKTFRLLQLGAYHAFAGQKVLFACYNKVLAADIRRLFSYSVKLPISEGSLVVQDIFSIAKKYTTNQHVSDYDSWGKSVVEKMRNSPKPLPKYNTILIDEAQDMKDWALEMLELLGVPNASICVAAGSGQELYGNTSEWLKNFDQVSSKKRLNRNFRNTAPVGRLAHVFYEAALDINKIERTLGRFPIKNIKSSEQLVMFERPEGKLPSLLNIDESNTGDTSTPFFYIQSLTEEYRRIIESQISQLTANERHLDLLVLVPNASSTERTCAFKALEALKVPFIDYTDEDNRRDITQPEMVRLCTFHSARGIEGRRVVIFGGEQLENLAQSVGVSVNSLGYITFSRSVFDCIVCVRPKQKSKVISFLEYTLKLMRSPN